MTPAGTLRRNRASVADLPSQDEHRQKTPGDPLTVVRGQLHFGQIEHLAILSSSVAQRIAFYPSYGKVYGGCCLQTSVILEQAG
jgi:hypothetical protein